VAAREFGCGDGWASGAIWHEEGWREAPSARESQDREADALAKKNPVPPVRNDKGGSPTTFFLFFYDGRWFKGAVLFIHPCNPVCFILIAANGIYDKS
jgi:hypothetical protein